MNRAASYKLRLAVTTDGVNTSLLFRPTEQEEWRTVATYDFKDAMKTGVVNQLPALMVETSYLWTASDPTLAMFERRMALLEGAEACRGTGSGMAAVFAALMCQLHAGDRVVAARAMFGSCHYILAELLPRFGVETVLVDGPDLDRWADALSRPTRCVFFETPANPTLELVDIEAVSNLAHGAGASVIVDNVFSTPLLQKPLQLGADVVVYSGTKHIDGQGRCLGGAVLGGEEFCTETLQPFLRHTGPALSPFNAWILLKGLETLDLRVERQCRNAAALADRVCDHPAVERVIFPGRADHPQAALVARQMSGPGTVVCGFWPASCCWRVC